MIQIKFWIVLEVANLSHGICSSEFVRFYLCDKRNILSTDDHFRARKIYLIYRNKLFKPLKEDLLFDKYLNLLNAAV